MTTQQRTPILYGLMLRLLPRRFREEYGDEMARLFLDRRREAGASPRARAGVWARGAGDLASQALAERWQRKSSQPQRNSLSRRGASPLEQLLADVRYALRGLRQSPGFAAAAIATLALGIGANVAIFTAVNSVLLRPLPFAEPDRLVRVWPQMNFNMAMIGRVAEGSPALETISGMSGWLFTLMGEGEPQQISGVMVSWNHFELLGAQPALGRSFSAEEGLVGQADVVILSHDLWTSAFGANPGIIGRRVRLAAGQYQTRRVIGVMPADFEPVEAGFKLWSPLDIDPTLPVREDSSWYVNVLLARLAPDATPEQATTQVRAIARSLHQEWPQQFEEENQRTATVEPLHAYMVRDLDGSLWTLLGAVGVLLLIACVNVANLLLARGNARARDLAMRAALGATRGRLLAQLLTESVVLGVGGCLTGLFVAWAGFRLIASAAPEAYHQVASASIDASVLAFATGASLTAMLLCGAVPAWRSSTGHGHLRAGQSSGHVANGGGRLTSGLVAAEVALSVVLVAGAGLMLRSLWNLYTDDLGFESRGVLTFRISIPEGRFEGEALPPHYRQIWDAVNAIPGVETAGGIHLLPLAGNNWSFPYVAEDHPVPDGTPLPSANHRIVTPSYFETLAIPLLRGRGFTAADTGAAEAVGMLNERMAADLWPDADPIGKKVTVFGSTFTVVGVVGDIRQHGLRFETQQEMYRPFDQWPTGGMYAVIRTSGDPMAIAPSVRQAIWDVDADIPLAEVRRMREVFGESVAVDRFVSLLIGAFAGLALVLATIGVYGVTAYATGRRLAEFGVRMAIGADRTVVLRQAISDGMKPAALGIVVGLLAAWGATRWLSDRLYADLLYEVTPYDATTFIGVPLILLAVATLACAIPAWQASRLDPVTVLRGD